jgi:hypothetical protein
VARRSGDICRPWPARARLAEATRVGDGAYNATATPPDVPEALEIPAGLRHIVFDALLDAGVPLRAVAMAFNRADGGTDDAWAHWIKALVADYEAARDDPSRWRRVRSSELPSG